MFHNTGRLRVDNRETAKGPRRSTQVLDRRESSIDRTFAGFCSSIIIRAKLDVTASVWLHLVLGLSPP